LTFDEGLAVLEDWKKKVGDMVEKGQSKLSLHLDFQSPNSLFLTKSLKRLKNLPLFIISIAVLNQ